MPTCKDFTTFRPPVTFTTLLELIAFNDHRPLPPGRITLLLVTLRPSSNRLNLPPGLRRPRTPLDIFTSLSAVPSLRVPTPASRPWAARPQALLNSQTRPQHHPAPAVLRVRAPPHTSPLSPRPCFPNPNPSPRRGRARALGGCTETPEAARPRHQAPPGPLGKAALHGPPCPSRAYAEE